MTLPKPGWYPSDPSDLPNTMRWWDGEHWGPQYLHPNPDGTFSNQPPKKPSAWNKLTTGVAIGTGIIAFAAGAAFTPPSPDAPAAAEIAPITQTLEDDPADEEPETSPEKPAEPDVAPIDPSSAPIFRSNAAVSISDSTTTTTTALELLETLDEKGRAPKTGYDRAAKFGTPWTDVDKNGCDTRNDILFRDLTSTQRSGPCKVTSGTLNDKYTGNTIQFVRGNTTSTLVQIDHVVPLADAWQKGAQQLTQTQRISFANDPLNLMAVDGPTNSAKGAGDAATWLPRNTEYRCEYVAKQISVKATYDLWVTPSEKTAMKRVLTNCPEQVAFTSPFTPAAEPAPEPAPAPEPEPEPEPEPAPAPAPAPAPVPAPAPAPAPVATHYQNCTAARNAGAAPVHIGQPGYGRHLDRDGDGIGCE